MAQYSDGTEARVGDLVFGGGRPNIAPVAGYVQAIDGDWTVSNIVVATMRPFFIESSCGPFLTFVSHVDSAPLHAMACIHHGTACHFTLLHRAESREPAATS